MQETQTHLVPVAEMTPGQLMEIRNSVITRLVADVMRELSLKEEQLVVRDIEPYTDLSWDYGTASAGTAENWERDFTETTVGYVSVVGSTAAMGDQRYVAIFGVRDLRLSWGGTGGATQQGGYYRPVNPVSLIKFDVGGATKAIWDITGLQAYKTSGGAFTPGAVIIPQNASFNIYFYKKNVLTSGTSLSVPSYIQLVGVTVEPRGKVISP